MFPECKLKEDALHSYWPAVTPAMVRASLDRDRLAFSDFLNLISPAAAGEIDGLRERAAEAKRTHFGKVIRLYAPIYISNYCVNGCVYCAFQNSHKYHRRRLTLDEIDAETDIIKGYGMDSLLIVCGEDPQMTVDFLVEVVKRAKRKFAYIGIEIHPQEREGYRRLFEAGVQGLTIYQETFQEDLYKKLHPCGPKSDYHRRLRAPMDGAAAGFYNVGLGFLLGLYDWRIEAVSLAANGLLLRKKYWQTKVQFSFPRITAIPGGYNPPSPVNDADLEQLMLAFRIYFPESEIFISTREKFAFRMHMAPLCVSHISAGSQVNPGGYGESLKKVKEVDQGQFTVNDQTSVPAVVAGIRQLGLDPVFKDWDGCISTAV